MNTKIESPKPHPKCVKLWDFIPKCTSNQPIERIVLESDSGGFANPGEAAAPVDRKYFQSNANVRCFQVGGSVTQAQRIIHNSSDYLTKGDSNIVLEEWNGIYAQHGFYGSNAIYSSFKDYMESGLVIDLQGKILTQEWIEKGADTVHNHNGNADCVWGPPTVMSSIAWPTFGVSLNSDECLKKPGGKLLAHGGAIHNMAPNPPVETEPSPIRDPSSEFVVNEWGALETMFYAVSAVNKYGESTLTLLNKAAKLAGSPAVLAFAATPSPDTGFIIYRSEVTSETDAEKVKFFPIFRISATELANGYDGAPPGQVYDRNWFLPNTEEAFITQMREEVLCFKVAPISELDTDTGTPIFWGTPVLHCPKKLVRFINIGA